jgi:hypothetical protein
MGRVVAIDGSPLADADVTILETGESGRTDAGGHFMIQTLSLEDSWELEIAKENDTVRTTILFADEESQGVQVPFPYFDDATHCVYEIVVPYNQSQTRPVDYDIATFIKHSR